ncbi:MAG: type III-B CRISPR module-associated protein Cmr5 [Polyangiales bacterium]
MSGVMTWDQRRASHAWKQVQVLAASFKGKDKERKQFASELRRLPVRVMNAGLVPAILFLQSKKKATEVVTVLDDWMKQRFPGGAATLRERALLDATQLRMHTAETLAYLQWLVRFAEAEGLLEGAENGDE